MTIALIIAACSALTISLALTPLVRSVARKHGFVDAPDGQRKLQSNATALGGGFAVFVASGVVSIVAIAILAYLGTLTNVRAESLIGMLAAGTLIVVVGFLDDRYGMRGRQKLLGQIAASSILIATGLNVGNISVLGLDIQLGVMSIPFTLCWMLGSTNAINLIDGADGFASTVSIVICTTLAAIAAVSGHPVEAIIAASIAGATMGFFLFNWPPASIYLGDTGSLFLGFSIGALAISGSLKGPATVALAAPLAVLAVPFLDSAAAFLRRKLTGRSIYATDRAHLHHMLTRRGLSPRSVVVGVGVLSVVTSIGALTSVYLHNEMLALMSAVGVVGVLIASKTFGYSEFVLVANRFSSFAGSLVATRTDQGRFVRQQRVHLQGSRNWDEVWETVTDFAQRHDLLQVRLELNAGWLHESFHANWERISDVDPSDRWSASVPLAASARRVGSLHVSGAFCGESVNHLLVLLAEMLESLEPSIEGLEKEISPENPEPQTSRKRGGEVGEAEFVDVNRGIPASDVRAIALDR